MRCYQIYWIENEFATFFYGKERIFYSLFYQWKQSNGHFKDILHKQVEYITKPIPFLQIQKMIHAELSKKGINFKVGDQVILEDGQGNGAKLEIYDRYISIDSWGNDIQEAIFFEILRKDSGRLLAVDTVNEQFGWLRPIKQRKYV